MTIQAFSIKTGISKSKLRFYESKKILSPERDRDSGYRLYSEEQVSVAKLIASLRSAGIAIQEIDHYLRVTQKEQMEMKQKWIRTIRERQRLLEVSLHYLESEVTRDEVYLLEKPAEEVLWFSVEAAPSQFREDFIEKRNLLKQHNIPVNNTYLRYLSGNRKLIKADIGFGITNSSVSISGAVCEKMRECLCIGSMFKDDLSTIQSAYRKLIQYCMERDLTPIGPILEWYRGDQIDTLDIVLPVIQLGGNNEG